jgi:hypothetical protein
LMIYRINHLEKPFIVYGVSSDNDYQSAIDSQLTVLFTFSSLPEARAVRGSAARTDLCGGRWATSVPTATLSLLRGESGWNPSKT